MNAVNWAYDHGIIDDSFQADALCTRSDTVTYMWKAYGSTITGNSSFTDVPPYASYTEAVKWAVENKITTGTGDGTTFSPDLTCDRAQIVTFLYRARDVEPSTVAN